MISANAAKQEGPSYARIYMCAMQVLGFYFGLQWLEDWVMSGKKAAPYFKDWEGKDGPYRAVSELLELVDLLLNLQDKDGFWNAVNTTYRFGPGVGTSELYAGDILDRLGIPFSFREANGTKGESYDLSLMVGNVEVCGETKVKGSETVFNPKSFYNSLERARSKNLPRDKPGIVFAMAPDEWVMPPEKLPILQQAIEDMLAKTETIAGVMFGGYHLFLAETGYSRVLLSLFVKNKACKFDIPEIDQLSANPVESRRINAAKIWGPDIFTASENNFIEGVEAILKEKPFNA